MKQFLIVVGVIALIVGVTIIAAYFGRSMVNKAAFDKGQRFTAKPGTTRKNAVALTSNKRPTTSDPKDAIARQASEMEDDSPLTVKSLSAPSGGDRSSPANDRAIEALNSGSAESGLRMLNEALALPHDRQQAACIQEAMGQLYAQLDPPDFEGARAAFDAARALTDDPEMEQSILLKSVQLFMQGGLDDAAREQLENGFVSETMSNQTQFQLGLLRGQLEERSGHANEAESQYRQVLDAAMALPETIDRDTAIDLVRLAGLRLTSLYRAQDREEAADSLARELKRQLKTLEDAA